MFKKGDTMANVPGQVIWCRVDENLAPLEEIGRGPNPSKKLTLHESQKFHETKLKRLEVRTHY